MIGRMPTVCASIAWAALAGVVLAGQPSASPAEEPVADAPATPEPPKPEPKRPAADDAFPALRPGRALGGVEATVTGLSREDGAEVRRWFFGRTRLIDRWRTLAQDLEMTGLLEFRTGARSSLSIALNDAPTEMFIERLTWVRVGRVPDEDAAGDPESGDRPAEVIVELRVGKIVVVPLRSEGSRGSVTVVTPHGETVVTGITEFVVTAGGTQQRPVAEPSPIPKAPPKKMDAEAQTEAEGGDKPAEGGPESR